MRSDPENTSDSSDLYGPSESEKEDDVPRGTENKMVDETSQIPSLAKRKGPDEELQSPVKRRRLTSEDSHRQLPPCAGLPAEIWHHVFCFVDPRTLAKLLQVNRIFNHYLSRDERSAEGPSIGRLEPLDPETIWSSSRKRFMAGFPRPLSGLSELDMLRLANGKRCQFCGKKGQDSRRTEPPWAQGPGFEGVRIVWPFGIRTCGTCLKKVIQNDKSLLFSSASPLLPALPFTFITNEMHVISASVLRDDVTLPPNLQIVKYYYKRHADEIQAQLKDVQALGPEVAEEWFKGLEKRGKDRMDDAERCERWESKLRSADKHSTASSAVSNLTPTTLTPHSQYVRPSPPGHDMSRVSSGQGSVRALPKGTLTGQPNTQNPYFPLVQPRERSMREVNEAKALRKADIERRCALLDPPIPPNILRHMDSFKAAIQISTPMTDRAWELLKPRLLAQRAAAEHIEKEQVMQAAALQAKVADRRQQDASIKELKEALDREWDESQQPIRDRLGLYADELIREEWAGGIRINKENSPKFAADLLLYVRRRFYEELTKEEDSKRVSGQLAKQDEPGVSTTRKLLLENMKWVFDNKIRPLTEQFRKELFLCHVCEGNSRFYGFEGVIQHYGAKHTNSFSVGNVVVHWREAEWPEDPPFQPDPSISRAPLYSMASSHVGQGHKAQSYGPYQYGGYSRASHSTPLMAPQPLSAHSHMSPAPFGAHQYGNRFNGPYAPPTVPPPVHGSYDHPFVPPAHITGPVPNMPYNMPQQTSFYGHPQPYDGYSGHAQPPYAYGNPTVPPRLYPPEPTEAIPNFVASGSSIPVHRGITSWTQAADGATPGEIQERLGRLSHVLGDLWSNLSHIPDRALPTSMRVYVIVKEAAALFRHAFGIEPTLDMFIEVLQNSPYLYSLKSVSCFSCKSCLLDVNEVSGNYSYITPGDERKSYSLLSLMFHFKSQHLQHFESVARATQAKSVDAVGWEDAAIALPPDNVIADIVRTSGMDHELLKLFARAFPSQVLATPAQGDRAIGDSLVSIKRGPAEEMMGTPGHSGRGSVQISNGSPADPRPRSLHGMDEDEYDPRHPALLSQDWHLRPRYIQDPIRRSPSFDDYRSSLHSSGALYYLPERRYGHDDYYQTPSSREGFTGADIQGLPGALGLNSAMEGCPNPVSTTHPEPGESSPSVEGSYGRSRVAAVTEGTPFTTRVVPRKEGQAEAERFLNSFQPGPGLERYLRETTERRHMTPITHEPGENGARGSPLPPVSAASTTTPRGRGSEERTVLVASERRYRGFRERSDARGPGTGHMGRGHTEVGDRPVTGNPDDYRPGGYARRRYSRLSDTMPSRPIRSRYPRYMNGSREEPHAHGHRLQRTHSRYERYEAQRRQLDQERNLSHSPRPKEGSQADSQVPRATSTDRIYGEEPVHPPRHMSSHGSFPQRGPYSPEPPISRYRYPDERPVYVNEYGEEVRYIRVQESYPPPDYLLDSRAEPAQYVEYLPYHRDDMAVEDRRIYGEDRRLHESRNEARPYDAEPAASNLPPTRSVRDA